MADYYQTILDKTADRFTPRAMEAVRAELCDFWEFVLGMFITSGILLLAIIIKIMEGLT